MEIIVSNWNEALDAVNGLLVELDGILGNIKVERRFSKYYGAEIAKVMHEPVRGKKGKDSEAYQRIKRELRDDWSTDLTNSERLPQIMSRAGIKIL